MSTLHGKTYLGFIVFCDGKFFFQTKNYIMMVLKNELLLIIVFHNEGRYVIFPLQHTVLHIISICSKINNV
jgi:hypothetical protein